jgi:hypothetical protein
MFQAQGGVTMPTISRRREDGRISAIIRSYQPSRIERELLAQVFDLAEHPIQNSSVGLTEPSSEEDRASQSSASETFLNELEQPMSHMNADVVEV